MATTLLVAAIPFVGGVLAGLLGLAGVGACVLELYARRWGPGDAVTTRRRVQPAPVETSDNRLQT